MPTIIEFVCTNCASEFGREKRQVSSSIAKNVSNYFCSRSCNVSYNNKHKDRGDLRSSIEIWIESRVKDLWPNLEVHFNRKDAVGSELDIYIPSLALAFEINGRSHYEPIWGEEVFQKTLANDLEKAKACQTAGIELIIVDAGKYVAMKRDPNFEKIVNSVLGVLRARVKN